MGCGVGDEERVDFVLSEEFLAEAFADINAFGARRNQGEHFPADQRVVENDGGFGEEARGFAGEQFRIAGTRAH